MTVLTKAQVSAIRADLNTAFAVVAKKHGMDFSLGTIRFGTDTMSGKLTGVSRSAVGATGPGPVDLKALALVKNGKFLLGQSFIDTAKYRSQSLGAVKFVGYNSRARAYPFVVMTSGGKRYKISSASAKSMVNDGAIATV
jgi:hypothetical protein